jgi:hypothetical protein
MNKKNLKVCSRCKKLYPANSNYFHRHREKRDGLDSWCKSCKKDYHKNYYKLKNFNLSKEEFKNLLIKQDYRCGICGVKFKEIFSSYNYPQYDYDPDIDHDHETGEVRGLLCLNCNRGLGRVKENIKILENAVHYLRKQ